ncbi:MAG: hypothetical protein RL468_2149 [Pseudomonadota bacterium]
MARDKPTLACQPSSRLLRLKRTFMKNLKLVTLVVGLAMLADSAMAHAGRSSIRVGVSIRPVYTPMFYPSLRYYPVLRPAVYVPVIVPQQPLVYIEQAQAVPQNAAPPGSWYYCEPAQAYYPYVKECAAPWLPVPAQAAQ